jgi:hypothetical protein
VPAFTALDCSSEWSFPLTGSLCVCGEYKLSEGPVLRLTDED